MVWSSFPLKALYTKQIAKEIYKVRLLKRKVSFFLSNSLIVVLNHYCFTNPLI